jgi:hypothetical protein
VFIPVPQLILNFFQILNTRFWFQFSATTVHTINSCESYNLRLNRRFYRPYPNILNFMDEIHTNSTFLDIINKINLFLAGSNLR